MFTINRENFVHENIHMLNICVNIFRAVSQENTLTQKFCKVKITLHLLPINPLTHIVQLTDLKTECTLITKARKLALYACLCVNGYNMITKRPTEKLSPIGGGKGARGLKPLLF